MASALNSCRTVPDQLATGAGIAPPGGAAGGGLVDCFGRWRLHGQGPHFVHWNLAASTLGQEANPDVGQPRKMPPGGQVLKREFIQSGLTGRSSSPARGTAGRGAQARTTVGTGDQAALRLASTCWQRLTRSSTTMGLVM